MPVITVQLGQCGNQLGCSLFQALASELGTGEYHASGLEEWFRPVASGDHQWGAGSSGQPAGGAASYQARSVLIDMEPKVVQSVMHQASKPSSASGASSSCSWWRYPHDRHLCMSSGAGNNWAHGFHGYGPRVRDVALDLVRREAEACDVLGGFLLLQSMAGGTGAGLGTYVAAALRDEFPSTHALNCCVWPYESGEVIVQSYNTLLTLSHLADVSDGIVLLQNEALHATAKRLHNIARPSFADMNMVAARSLACMLLPSHHRPGGGPFPLAPQSPGQGATGNAASALQQQHHQQHQRQRPLRVLPELLGHCAPHPGYRLMSLRSLPQVPASSVDFTTFTWPAISKRLRQMMLTGSSMEEGLDWGVGATSSSPSLPPGSAGGGGGGAATPGGPSPQQASSPALAKPGPSSSTGVNRSLSSWLVLRGQGAGEVDVSGLLADPHLYSPSTPAEAALATSCHPARYMRCAMSAAQLGADQACVEPCRRMQARAQLMWSSRAYLHQYEAFGLQSADFEGCFAHTQDLLDRYAAL